MQNLGDYAEDFAALCFTFSTHKADGTPESLAGSPVPTASAYKGNSTTQSGVGVTLSIDFDGVTGLNHVLIDLSADAFYAIGNDYSVVLNSGTVDSVSVAGTVLATFSIKNRFNSQTGDAYARLGAPVALDGGGATISGMLTKIADDNAGADFDATNDSLHQISHSVGTIPGTPTAYAPSTATRTVGSDVGGSVSSLAAHDAVSMSTGEVNSTTKLEVDVVRTTSTVSQIPSTLRVSGYYSGSAGHSITVQAYNYTTSAFESKGTMTDLAAAFDYSFPLGADNHDGAGKMEVKFIHSTVATGLTSHRLHLDYISFEKVSTTNQIATDISAVKAATDRLQFTIANDVKATLDSETVDLTAGQLVFKKNVARPNFAFPMFDSAGALKTGLTVAAVIRKDAGASFAALAGAVTEIGATGWYTVDFAQAEVNADTIAFSASAAGANPTTFTILTQA